MRVQFRRPLLAAASVCGLLLSVAGPAAASKSAGPSPSPAPAPPAAHSVPKPTGGVTLRLAAVVGAGAAGQPHTAQAALSALSADPKQGWVLNALGGGRYEIRNDTGGCMTWAGPQRANSPVLLAKCGHNTVRSGWHFVPRGVGYQVQTDGGLCLNVQGGPYAGHGLIIYTCTPAGAPNDVWLPALRLG